MANADQNYYRLVLDSIDDYAIFTTDPQGLVTSWNNGAKQVLGYGEKEIIGADAAVFFTAADLKKSADKKEMINAKKHGSAIDERYHVRKDGSAFWASGKMFPLFDVAGKHLGFTKVMRNIDGRKRAEEQLKQLNNYAQAIVTNSRQPILVLDGALKIYIANQAFYSLFKLTIKQTENRSILQVANGLFNIPELAEKFSGLAQAGSVIENLQLAYDWPIIGKKYFVINASKLQHPVNSDNLLLFAIEDVTERKIAEQQKDDFISIASHEIRTPVTVIKAYAQIIQKRAAATQDQFLADTANKVNLKTDKLMSMVAYLLDAGQLELGELIIRKSHFDMNALVNESIDELKLIDLHEFRIRGRLNENIFADRFRISQVLNNLLNNASKYSSLDAPIQVHIRQNKKGDQVIISVKDRGIGIPKGEQVNLFKRFWRASSATSRNIAGIGLGLHVSMAVVRQHGGKIWLKSEKDKGSVFSFSLPL